MYFFRVQRIKIIFMLFITILLSGCGALFGSNGLFPSQQSDYLLSEEGSPIDTPPDIDGSRLDDVYPIPELQYASVLPERFSVPRVEPLSDTASKGAVRIQNLLDERWVLVNRAPTQTWPLILRFLNDNGIGIELEDAEESIIETSWLKDADRGEGFREKYRYVFRSGVQQNTTEVVIKQQLSDAADLSWKRSSDTERETSMANLLAQFLASSPEEVSHSLLAQGISTANKAGLSYTSDGQPYIELQLPFQRGWASVGLALQKAEFKVTDKDHDNGLYYANYEPSSDRRQAKRGLFSRLAFWRSKKDEGIRGDYKVTIVPEDNSGQEGTQLLNVKIKSDAGQDLQNNEQAYLLNRILVKLS